MRDGSFDQVEVAVVFTAVAEFVVMKVFEMCLRLRTLPVPTSLPESVGGADPTWPCDGGRREALCRSNRESRWARPNVPNAIVPAVRLVRKPASRIFPPAPRRLCGRSSPVTSQGRCDSAARSAGCHREGRTTIRRCVLIGDEIGDAPRQEVERLSGEAERFVNGDSWLHDRPDLLSRIIHECRLETSRKRVPREA